MILVSTTSLQWDWNTGGQQNQRNRAAIYGYESVSGSGCQRGGIFCLAFYESGGEAEGIDDLRRDFVGHVRHRYTVIN